jgi:DNA ligase-1
MAKRYFLMLAHVFKPRKHQAAGAFISEKLEGMRAFWDGGVSRGLKKNDVPYANVDKDERLLSEQIATGLWTRLGNVIHAPDWWLDKLPRIPLDGELFIGRGQWQFLMSTVKDFEPNEDWEQVKYYCFDMPSPDVIFANGNVAFSNTQEAYFHGIKDWLKTRPALEYHPKAGTSFRSTYTLLCKHLQGNETAIAHRQHKLPYGPIAVAVAEDLAKSIVAEGGEGCIIRDPASKWRPNRCHTMVKCKVYHDTEATVMGYTTGRQTDRGSKLLGKMGALILNYNGQRLEISGFTDEERVLTWTPDMTSDMDPESWASLNPGKDAPDWIQAKYFPRGTQVAFTYRALSVDGIPQEARFLRHADTEK